MAHEEKTWQLELAFEARGVVGHVSVSMSENVDPAAYGCAPAADGFPVCEATVATSLRGYNALLGWVQLVGTRTADAEPRMFEPDPLDVFSPLDLPFGFYGVHPTLFDAPSRRDRGQHLDWLAHSFLCISPSRPMDRIVQPVCGFRMGNGVVAIVPASPLDLMEWGVHLDQLRASYPTWQFEETGVP